MRSEGWNYNFIKTSILVESDWKTRLRFYFLSLPMYTEDRSCEDAERRHQQLVRKIEKKANNKHTVSIELPISTTMKKMNVLWNFYYGSLCRWIEAFLIETKRTCHKDDLLETNEFHTQFGNWHWQEIIYDSTCVATLKKNLPTISSHTNSYILQLSSNYTLYWKPGIGKHGLLIYSPV